MDHREFWRGRPTLVTGGTGLAGQWIVRRLVDLEADVVCLVRRRRADGPLRELLERSTVAVGDITTRGDVAAALRAHDIRTVMHVAAEAVVGRANLDPVPALETNVRGTWNLLDACRGAAVEQVVLASSDKAYGEPARLPIDEDAPLHGRHPYDVSKSCADLVAQMYAHTFHLPVAITRCGNFFGGGDRNWNRIVPGTIRSILRGERPVLRSDGQSIRDYLYIEDGAAAYTLLAERLAEQASLAGSAFNFSLEVRMTSLDLVRLILELMDCDLEPVIGHETAGEIRAQSLTSAKARARLGWRPRFSLREGLERTIAWYRHHLAPALAVP